MVERSSERARVDFILNMDQKTSDKLLRLPRRLRLPFTLATVAFATAFAAESRCLAPILPTSSQPSSQPSRQW